MFLHFSLSMVWMLTTHSSINLMGANHATAVCADVSRHIRSPVKMVIAATNLENDRPTFPAPLSIDFTGRPHIYFSCFIF